jgi:hypothetical protein
MMSNALAKHRRMPAWIIFLFIVPFSFLEKIHHQMHPQDPKPAFAEPTSGSPWMSSA